MQRVIFWPAIAQVALTAAVWLLMYRRRIAEFRRRQIDPQSVSDSRSAAGVLEDITAADNFRNLFEVPVLFLVLCVALAVTGQVTMLQVVFAWVYVGLRTVHTLIHTTYNRVMHRFTVYVLSTLCVFAMWGQFAVALWHDG
jgi:hypothetical protein